MGSGQHLTNLMLPREKASFLFYTTVGDTTISLIPDLTAPTHANRAALDSMR